MRFARIWSTGDKGGRDTVDIKEVEYEIELLERRLELLKKILDLERELRSEKEVTYIPYWVPYYQPITPCYPYRWSVIDDAVTGGTE